MARPGDLQGKDWTELETEGARGSEHTPKGGDNRACRGASNGGLGHSFIRSRVSLIRRAEDFGRQPMLLAFWPRVWISILSQNHPE